MPHSKRYPQRIIRRIIVLMSRFAVDKCGGKKRLVLGGCLSYRAPTPEYTPPSALRLAANTKVYLETVRIIIALARCSSARICCCGTSGKAAGPLLPIGLSCNQAPEQLTAAIPSPALRRSGPQSSPDDIVSNRNACPPSWRDSMRTTNCDSGLVSTATVLFLFENIHPFFFRSNITFINGTFSSDLCCIL